VVWISLIVLIPLLILVVLFLAVGVYGAYRLVTHGDPGQPRLAVVSTALSIVACDFALLFLLGWAVILLLQTFGMLSDVPMWGERTWFGVVSAAILAPAFILGVIALAIRVWLDVVLPWRSARQRGDEFWIGRHGDG
jgi:hypothetical protein